MGPRHGSAVRDGAGAEGKTLKLKDLNAGFTRPETIALAYYQASLLVDHIVTTYGQDALRRLLVAYGEGLEGEAALAKGLGASTDKLQASFDKRSTSASPRC